MKVSKMPFLENTVYYIFNILTFGALYISKIVLKKAITESLKEAPIWEK